MIDVKELRIGNLNIWGSEVCEVDADQLSSMQWGGQESEPIPLTEEWLVKFGWGKSDEHELCDNSSDIIFTYDWHFKKLAIEIGNEGMYLDHIKHVHSLQNLYKWLTGTELEIKE